MPAVAVIMPVYNRVQTVRVAIDSVLEQDFADFEMIVVDDGSTDGTPDAIEAIGDPRIRCLRQPANMGGNAARNRGIREAQSPLVCFIDSDDRFLPQKLGFVTGYFRDHPGVDVLLDSFQLTYPAETGRATASRTNPDLNSSAEVTRAIYAREVFKATPAISARRAALEKIGYFDETLRRRQDMDLILRLSQSLNVASTSEVLWIKQWSADSISAKQDTYVTAVIDMCERHPDYLTKPEFRVGLARDTARHFVRLGKRGRLGSAARDLRRCAGFFGWGTTMRLIGGGLVEMTRRAVARPRD